jgi:hypothetical protein
MTNKELNDKIAEKIMGWKKVAFPTPFRGLEWMWDRREGCLFIEAQTTPDYCGDIKYAWQVVEKMFEDDWLIEITGSQVFGPDMGGYDVMFDCKCQARGRFKADADTLSQAICKAALRAVREI